MSLLWDKADVRITNDELWEINSWAQQHARNCPDMKLIVEGHGTMTYIVEYLEDYNDFSIGGYCNCGCRYYVGEGECPPIGESR